MTVPATGGSVSASLLDRLRAGDGPAWDRLVELYAPLVEFWARRSGLQPADAEDVRQEVFHAVAGHIDSFDRTRPGATFRGWLRTITRSKLADHGRREGSRPAAAGGSTALGQLQRLPDESGGDEPDSPEEAEVLRGVWRRALAGIRGEFEPRTWDAFWRVAVGEEPVADVAAALGLSPAAVRLYKSRVLRRLREELGELAG